MAHAVFIPFRTINSTEHLQSTAGGFTNKLADDLSNMLFDKGLQDQAEVVKPSIILPGWGKIQPDRIVCADSPTLSNVLLSLTANDTLYIRGHCESGSSVLQSSDHSVNIDIPSIIEILNNKLPFNFAGKLKVYACQSASSSGALFWKEQSFAKRLSDAMIAAGWNACSYWGYTKEVTTYIVNGHKRVGNDQTLRASSVRARVG